ncbi:ATP-binding protein [Neobacillus sp. SCS-31]|uniref:ATP-binding protein n=1 Tax=Neobacillus oceani TaxID=3115292 RepID=UPI0039062536
MNKYYRFLLSIITIIILITVGIFIEENIFNLINQFWFSSGILLVILLSLVDQPFFSKDSNIFVNAITALVPLILLAPEVNTDIFKFILILVVYLAVSSFILMFIRKNKKLDQNKYIIFFSKINQILGKPFVLFSLLFIWGIETSYGFNSMEFNLLIIFWGLFQLFNNIGFASAFLNLFNKELIKSSNSIGNIFAVIAQNTFLVKVNNQSININKFDSVKVLFSGDKKIYKGIVFEKLLLDNEKWVKVITNEFVEKSSNEKLVSDEVYIIQNKDEGEIVLANLIGIVLEGSTIGKIKFQYNSNFRIYEGSVLEIRVNEDTVLYQVVDAKTELINLSMMNQSGFISAEAIQLGTWDNKLGNFIKYGWVPNINSPIFLANPLLDIDVGSNEYKVGNLPNTNYPVILNTELAITHHTAVVGVTGTGKSVFSRNLIRQYLESGAYVICIDFTGEYKEKFTSESPIDIIPIQLSKVIFAKISEIEKIVDANYNKDNDDSKRLKIEVFKLVQDCVDKFLNSDTRLAILDLPELDNSSETMKFTQTFFKSLFKIAKERKSTGNKICLVLEEAHTIIPEWNFAGVNDRNSQSLINSIAQIALQGRKYNIGLLVIAQRTANVSKTILTQCNSIIAFQQFDKTSVDFLANYLGSDIATMLPQLKFRQAIATGKAFRSNSSMIFEVPEIYEQEMVEDEHNESNEAVLEIKEEVLIK